MERSGGGDRRDPVQVLRLIETEALAAFRETRDPQDTKQLLAILEAAQARVLLGKRELKIEEAARRFPHFRYEAETKVPPRRPLAPSLLPVTSPQL